MKRLFFHCIMLLSAVALTACGDDNPASSGISPTLEIALVDMNVSIGSAESASALVPVTTNQPTLAFAYNGADWLSATFSAQDGTITVQSLSENPSTILRVGTVTVSAGTGADKISRNLIVMQDGVTPVLEIAPADMNVSIGSAANASVQIPVTTNQSSLAFIYNGATWLNATFNAQTGMITVKSLSANPTMTSRAGTVTVSAGSGDAKISKSLTVTQNGTTPTLEIAQGQRSVSLLPEANSSVEVTVTTNLDNLTLTPSAGWIQATFSKPSGKITVKAVSANNTDDDPRTGTVVVSGMGVASITLNVSQARKGYDVFLLIGQSNMAGRGTMVGDDETRIIPGVWLLNGSDVPEAAKNGLNRYSTVRKAGTAQGISPGTAFSEKVAAQTGRKVLLVVNALGGSAISSWAKGKIHEPLDSNTGLPKNDGSLAFQKLSLYDEAVRRTKKALEQEGARLVAILWHQGEGDSGSSSTYLSKLAPLVANLRADLNAPDVPFFAGELCYYRGGNTDAFNTMIRTIGTRISNAYWVSAEGATSKQFVGEPGPSSDHTHFSRAGQLVLGGHYADKVLEVCYSLP